jgi:hypothetical protein
MFMHSCLFLVLTNYRLLSRLGGVCSIHEIGGVNGREGLRAATLWQLGDILLSKSLWRHHSLYSYIHGLDRVQLRVVSNSDVGTG